MADDRHYVGGDNYLLDDLSGFKIRASRARVIPGGQTGNLAVAPERWEPQQPQDFVRGVWDDETVQIARPRQTNQFTYLATNVTAPSAVGSTSITVATTNGFAVGMNLQIMLDKGDNFLTSIVSLSGGNTMGLSAPLPGTVGTLYGDPIENLVVFVTYAAPFVESFYSDGGVLVLFSASGFPTSPIGLSAGAVWSNNLVVCVVPGGSASGSPAIFFGSVTPTFLLDNGAGYLPTSPASHGSLQLWNNGGVICIS